MPNSRNRRHRPTRAKTRRSMSQERRRARVETVAGAETESVALRELLQGPPTSKDLAAVTNSFESGKKGDLADCLRHELSGRYILESPHRFMLQDLLDQGENAAAWAYSRWCLDLAAQSMLLTNDPRFDRAVEFVTLAMYPATADELIEFQDVESFRMLAAQVAASDPIVRDLALFESGGLRDFIENTAQPGLLDRTDNIGRWVASAVSAYKFKDFRGCRLVLQDLVRGEEIEVLNLGAMSETVDECLVGRVVPISTEPGWMFATRPLAVDEHTARGVVTAGRIGGPLGWCTVLGIAVEDGRLSEGFHCGFTPFTSDLLLPELVVDDEGSSTEAGFQLPGQAAYLTELAARGHSADVANALAVLELCLTAAGISDHAAAVSAPHVTAALQTRGAFEAAREECTRPDAADAWWILAAVVPEHLAERCRVLARLAESRRMSTGTG